MKRLPLALLGLAIAANASAQRYEGSAFAADDEGRLLYTETHWLVGDATTGYRVVLYDCPDGAAFARKRVDLSGDAAAPDFEFDDARTGYREGVRTRYGRREVFYRARRDAREQTAVLRETVHGAIDAGFDAFVTAHWDAAGVVDMPFLVPSRLDYVDFRMQRLGDAAAGSRRFGIRLGPWYGFALPHMNAIYDGATRRLLEYRGLSNIRDMNGKNIDVRIEFPPDKWQPIASADEVRRAQSQSLTGHCTTD